MFILITAPNEVCGDETGAKTFATHKEAYDQMVAELGKCAYDAGVDVGNDEEFDMYVDYLGPMRAYVVDVCGWVILNVPGAFIPKEACEGLMRRIGEARDMYQDESRDDWFDADDICKDVCWELEEYIGKGV